MLIHNWLGTRQLLPFFYLFLFFFFFLRDNRAENCSKNGQKSQERRKSPEFVSFMKLFINRSLGSYTRRNRHASQRYPTQTQHLSAPAEQRAAAAPEREDEVNDSVKSPTILILELTPSRFLIDGLYADTYIV